MKLNPLFLSRCPRRVPSVISIRKRNCSLCEREFSTDNLPGTVSYRSVLQWKFEHSVPNTNCPSSKQRSFSKLYDVSYLCVFCSQFFNYQFGEFIDINKIEKSVLTEIGPESSDAEVDYSKSKIDSQLIRPISRLNQRISKDRLHLKASTSSKPSSHILRSKINWVFLSCFTYFDNCFQSSKARLALPRRIPPCNQKMTFITQTGKPSCTETIKRQRQNAKNNNKYLRSRSISDYNKHKDSDVVDIPLQRKLVSTVSCLSNSSMNKPNQLKKSSCRHIDFETLRAKISNKVEMRPLVVFVKCSDSNIRRVEAKSSFRYNSL